MTRDQATAALKDKLASDWDGADEVFEWATVGKAFWVAKIRMATGGMVLATFSPLTGLTIFDSACTFDGKAWRDY